MTGWIVFGAIVLLLVVLLSLSVVVVVDAHGGELAATYRLGPLKIRLFPRDQADEQADKPPKKAKKKRRRKRGEKVQKEAKEKPKEKFSLEDLGGYVTLGRQILEASGKGLRRIFRGIRITELELDFAVPGEDAADAAISYGRTGGLVWYALGLADEFFTLSVRSVDLTCAFEPEQGRYEGHAAVKLRHATILAAAFGIGFRLLVILIKEKRTQKRDR